MLLQITGPSPPRTQGKIARRSEIALEFSRRRRISHKGKLARTRTSVFGRCGRTIIRFLTGKLNEFPFTEAPSGDDIDILFRGVRSLRARVARIVDIRPEYVIYRRGNVNVYLIALSNRG